MVYALAAWTVFVWGTRISNIVDGGISGAGSVFDLAVAGALAALGLVVAVAAWRGGPAWPLPVLVLATVTVWVLRTPLILLDPDHDLAFKAVHAALALVSLGLAAAAWRSTRGQRWAGGGAVSAGPPGGGGARGTPGRVPPRWW